MEQLKRCPFCGGEAKLQRRRRTSCGYYVICKNCGVRTPFFQYQFDSWEKLQEEAITAWNTRKPTERILGQLEERHKNHSATINEFISNNDLESASKESLMKTECEIAIEIVKGELTFNH